MDKKKLLWVSDAPSILNIGQSVVGRECLSRLQQWYDVEALGFGHGSMKDPIKLPYNVISCNRPEMKDVNKVAEYLRQSKPDVVIFSHDIWLSFHTATLRALFPNIKFIAYLTVDAEPVYYGWRHDFKGYHKIITPSHWSKAVLLDRFCELNVDVVPYGIDHGTFRPPQQGKEALKQQIEQLYAQSGYKMDITGRFLGIFIGNNQQRKNLGLIHESWREFIKTLPGSSVGPINTKPARLIMVVHGATLGDTSSGEYDLACFVQDTEDTVKVINVSIPQDMLGALTAAADVLFHPALAGGFELTVAQSMAAGTVPIIIPYSAITDYCTNQNTYQIPFMLHTGAYHCHVAMAPVANAVECLKQAFTDVEGRKARSQNGIVTASKYTWDICADGLHQSIEDTLRMDAEGLYVSRLK